MAGFEQKDRSSERQTAPCEILRLVQPRGVGQASPMIFHVHAYVDDHLLGLPPKQLRKLLQKRSNGMSSEG